MFRFIRFVSIGLCFLSTTALAQSGGSYEITHSVIASGGGSSTSGSFSLTGTIGQGIVNTTSATGVPYRINGGFWHPTFSPTAAMVSVSGIVRTNGGRNINKAVVTLSFANGTARSVISNAFGYFRFDDVPAGQTIIINAKAKNYNFTPITMSIFDEIADFELLSVQ